jgi:hypothetical protein
MVKELRRISEANNELLGFICSKVAPTKKIYQEDIDITDMAYISMEMSEIFEKYNISPDEFGIS